MSVLFTVFAPTTPLSRVRWNYQQNEDGTVVRYLTLKDGRETEPSLLNTDDRAKAGGLGNALEWARCFHSGKPHFDCREAQEIYSTLCNVVMHLREGPDKYAATGARVCLDGIITDCQEWLRRLEEQDQEAAA